MYPFGLYYNKAIQPVVDEGINLLLFNVNSLSIDLLCNKHISDQIDLAGAWGEQRLSSLCHLSVVDIVSGMSQLA